MTKAWTAWCEEWTAKAIAKDAALRDADLMGRTIRDERYKFNPRERGNFSFPIGAL